MKYFKKQKPFKQGQESTNRCILRVTQSHSESLKSYQELRKAVQSRPELLRGTPEQSGNGLTDRPTDGPTDGPTDRRTDGHTHL